MKKYLIAIAILGFIGCTGEKNDGEFVAGKNDTAITTGLLVINVSTNEYTVATLQRVIHDTTLLVTTDTSGGKLLQEKKLTRDTLYHAWWPFKVPDSTGKVALKNRLGQDSIIFQWTPLNKNMVITDYNQNWKR